MTTTSQANRRSPSGPVADIQLPIYGAIASQVGASNGGKYFEIGDKDLETDEQEGQYLFPEAGVLRKVTIRNAIVGGTALFAIAYEVHLNGVLIASNATNTVQVNGVPAATAAGTLTNESIATLVIGLTQPVAEGDQVSIKATIPAFGGGTAPSVSVTAVWGPGALT